MVSSLRTAWLLLSFRRAVVGRDTFSQLQAALGFSTKKLTMFPSSAVHGSQCDTKYVCDIQENIARATFYVLSIKLFLILPGFTMLQQRELLDYSRERSHPIY